MLDATNTTTYLDEDGRWRTFRNSDGAELIMEECGRFVWADEQYRREAECMHEWKRTALSHTSLSLECPKCGATLDLDSSG